MKSLFTLVLLVAASWHTAAFAQPAKHSVSGVVTDSSARKPLQYVTVELFMKAQPQQVLKSAYTNDKGKFKFEGLDDGQYSIILSHTGFGEKHLDFNLDATSAELSLSEVNLNPVTSSMQGIVVKARKPLIEQTNDKIIFNVENDPATKTETAIDILRKTPFVSVDGDNNVQVNGQSNFKVLLNGRETSMFAQNVKEALKGFPGSLITKIEVITTPSAKYDAEGVGGIINIITKKKVVGYNGSVNTWYSSNGWYNVNGNFSAKFGKVGMTGFYGSSGGLNVPGRSLVQTIPNNPLAFTSRTQVGTREMNNFWNNGNAEVSWDVDSLNTISFYGNISGGWNRNQFNQTITTSYQSKPDSISYYDLNSRNRFPTKSVGADYIRKYPGSPEKEFTIRMNGEFGNSNTYLNSVMDNQVVDDRYVINNSEAKNIQYTLQSDYTYPVKPNIKFEVGAKAIIRKANSDFESLIRTNNLEAYTLNSENTDKFFYDQNVYSGYGSYSFKLKNTSFRLGARYEHTGIDGDFVTSKTQVRQSYSNLLPNIQVSRKMNNALTMVLTYSDRIQRPFIWNLNPFRNNNDPRFISFGNPDLQPQVIHALALQTRLNKGGTFVGLTLTGTYSDNMIVAYSSYDETSGVTSTTSANLGKESAMNASGNVNTKINKDWSVSLNGNIRYNYVKNKMMPDQAKGGFGGNANLNTNYTISKKFNASAYAGFFRQAVTIQTSYPLNLWYGIHAGYKFFNEKLNASIGLSNFLQKEMDWKSITKDPRFLYTSTTTSPFRGLAFSLSWNFGKMTEDVSKKKGVTNDDLLR